MIRKLLENWLDNASERSYQQVFVQMLSAHGYTVLHSTRHCLLEFGKDVLAIAPDGVGCAFQLKGDPQGQMTVGEFRKDIQQQCVQLMSQTPAFPGFPPGAHRSFLVSNGSFSEEVQLAVAQMNASPLPSKIELWSRGNLLEMALKASESLWPSEIGETRILLDLYMADAGDQLPLKLLDQLLSSVLHIDAGGQELGRREFERAASSALWATGIALANYARAENHQAVALGWTLCRSLLECASARHGRSDEKVLVHNYQIAENAALDAVSALWTEVQEGAHLVMPPGLEDSEVYAWRISTLSGLLAVLHMANAESPCLPDGLGTPLTQWLESVEIPDLWGEAAIAQLVPVALVLARSGSDEAARNLLGKLAREVIARNQSDSISALPTPYYLGEDALMLQLGLGDGGSNGETFDGASYMARPLMLCMAHLGMKQECHDLWANYTRITHRYLEFRADEDFHSFNTREGTEVSKIFPSTYGWADLQGDAEAELSNATCSSWFECMWWQAAPHRANARSMLKAVHGAFAKLEAVAG